MDTQQVVEETTDRTEVEHEGLGRNRRWRTIVIIALVLVLAATATMWFVRAQQQSAQQTAQQAPRGRASEAPVQVGAATAGAADLPVAFEALGTVTPLATVTVRTRI